MTASSAAAGTAATTITSPTAATTTTATAAATTTTTATATATAPAATDAAAATAAGKGNPAAATTTTATAAADDLSAATAAPAASGQLPHTPAIRPDWRVALYGAALLLAYSTLLERDALKSYFMSTIGPPDADAAVEGRAAFEALNSAARPATATAIHILVLALVDWAVHCVMSSTSSGGKRGSWAAVFTPALDICAAFSGAFVLALWVASVGAVHKVAVIIAAYSTPPNAWAVGSSRAMVARVWCSVVVWALVVVTSTSALVKLVSRWKALWEAATGSNESASSSFRCETANRPGTPSASDCPATATPAVTTPLPAPAQQAHPFLHGAALLLAVSTLAAQFGLALSSQLCLTLDCSDSADLAGPLSLVSTATVLAAVMTIALVFSLCLLESDPAAPASLPSFPLATTPDTTAPASSPHIPCAAAPAPWRAAASCALMACLLTAWAGSAGVGVGAAVVLMEGSYASTDWISCSINALLLLACCNAVLWACNLGLRLQALMREVRKWQALQAMLPDVSLVPGQLTQAVQPARRGWQTLQTLVAGLAASDEAAVSITTANTTGTEAVVFSATTTPESLMLALRWLAPIVLHAVALVLATGMFVAQCMLVTYTSLGYETVDIPPPESHAPILVFTSAIAAAAAASLLLLGALPRPPPKPSTFLCWWMNPAGGSPAGTPLPLWPAVTKAAVAAIALTLSVAALAVAGINATSCASYVSGMDSGLYNYWGFCTAWQRRNSAVLVFACCSVLAWAIQTAMSTASLIRLVWSLEERQVQNDAGAAPAADPAPDAHALSAQATGATKKPLMAPAQKLRLALHAAAMLLAAASFANQAVLMFYIALYTLSYPWAEDSPWPAPLLVMATSLAALVTAARLAVAHARAYGVLPRDEAGADAVAAGSQPLRAAVHTAVTLAAGVTPKSHLSHVRTEVTLAASALVLWFASLGASGATANVVWRNSGTRSILAWPAWQGVVVVGLALESGSVLVWTATLLLSTMALVRAVPAWKAWWAGDKDGCNSNSTSSAAAARRFDAASEAAGKEHQGRDWVLHDGLRVAGMLLAIGVLVAQAVLMGAEGDTGTDPMFSWRKGRDMATAPGLVIVAAVFAVLLAGAPLAVSVCGYWLPQLPWDGTAAGAATGAAPSELAQRLWPVSAEPVLVGSTLVLWLASIWASAATASKLTQPDYCPQVWVDANAAALALECCSVLVWLATLLLSAKPLVTAMREWRARIASRCGGTYEALCDAESVSDAGCASGSADGSDAAPDAEDAPDTGSSPQPVLSELARLGLLAAAITLTTGVLVAQVILIGCDYSNSSDDGSSDKSPAPTAALITALTALVLAGIPLGCLLVHHIQRRRPGLPAAKTPCGVMPLWAAAAEAALMAWLLALLAACIGVSARTASALRHSSQHSARSACAWVATNAVVLAFACCSMLVWAPALLLSLKALVPALLKSWAERLATGGLYLPLSAAEEDPAAERLVPGGLAMPLCAADADAAAEHSAAGGRYLLLSAADVDTEAGASGSTIPRTRTVPTSGGDGIAWLPHRAARPTTVIALYVLAIAVGMGVLLTQAILFTQGWYSVYYSRSMHTAAETHIPKVTDMAPGLITMAAVCTVVLGGLQVAIRSARRHPCTRAPLAAWHAQVAESRGLRLLVAIVEADLAFGALALWIASLCVSASTVHILVGSFSSGLIERSTLTTWLQGNSTLLALECISVLVWMGCALSSLVAVTRAAPELVAQVAAVAGCHAPLPVRACTGSDAA